MVRTRGRSRAGLWARAAAVTVLAACSLYAAAAGVEPPKDSEEALHRMSARADVIFVGQVMSVRQIDGGGVASGVVEITFRVDQAVRGCTANGPYVLREWAGLWGANERRYRTGQKLLMLLHAPGASGLSSPVDGLDGAIPIVRAGAAPLAEGTWKRLSTPTVDLRWIAMKAQRPVSYRQRGQAAGSIAGAAAVVQATPGNNVQEAPVMVAPLSAAPGSYSVPAEQASVDAVVQMLNGWQKAQHAK